MSIEVVCVCGKRLRAPDEAAGKRARCMACRRVLLVPSPQAEETYGVESAAPPPPAAPLPVKKRSEPTEKPARPAAQPEEVAYGCAEDGAFPSKGTYGLTAEPPRDAPPLKKWDSLSEPEPLPAEDAGSESPRRKRRSDAERVLARRAAAVPQGAAATIREYMYLVLLLTLIPLVVITFRRDDTKERWERTISRNEGAVERVLQRFKDTRDFDPRAIFDVLPGRRIEGAHLPYGSWGHWLYAGAAALVFFGIVLTMFRADAAQPGHVIVVGVFTATLGILFLIAVQYIAMWTQGTWLTGRNILVVIFYVFKFIGFSYRSALDEDANIVLSMLGFTFGVGLCEELCKALPLLWHFRRNATLGWRGACLWGLATGVGFGVSEGITYSSDFYNGIHTANIYVVRFVSCVALHAIWSASVGITIWKCQELIQGDMAWYELAVPVFRVLGVAMVLHGLYDTLLKKEMPALALVVAILSFAWLAFQIERERRLEGQELAAAT